MKTKPFLKWPGGKRAILPQILPYVPKNYNRYFEPFLGAGALFFTLQPKKAFLSDMCEELIDTYLAIRVDPQGIIWRLKRHLNNQNWYYSTRRINPADLSIFDRAARFIYLNRTCFNGLYRVNSRGQFNVSFGNYKNPNICDEKNLIAVSKALENVSFRYGDFSYVAERARYGDFVYLDPPYYGGFTHYTAEGFMKEDQERLASMFHTLVANGAKPLLSNSNTSLIRDLYRDYKIIEIEAPCSIAAKVSSRGKVKELLIKGY